MTTGSTDRPPTPEDVKADIKIKKELFAPMAEKVRQRLAEIEEILATDDRFIFEGRDNQDLTGKEQSFRDRNHNAWLALKNEYTTLEGQKQAHNSAMLQYQLYGMTEHDANRLAEAEKYFAQHVAPVLEFEKQVKYLTYEYDVKESIAVAYLLAKLNKESA